VILYSPTPSTEAAKLKLPGRKDMVRLLCLIILLTNATMLIAATGYISDELRVPLRESPCNGCSILHRGLKSGTKLDIVESADGWSRVVTSVGLDGWLESQYLQNNPIARDQLEDFREQNKSLKIKNSEAIHALAASQIKLKELDEQLLILQEENQGRTKKLAEISDMSETTLSIHTQNQELLKQNKMLQSEIDVLTATTEQLTNSNTQTWFFFGALSVFFGAILSILLPRLKRKPRGYSEWA
jgi:SH3 domain protein